MNFTPLPFHNTIIQKRQVLLILAFEAFQYITYSGHLVVLFDILLFITRLLYPHHALVQKQQPAKMPDKSLGTINRTSLYLSMNDYMIT